jgi:hypothetical protein
MALIACSGALVACGGDDDDATEASGTTDATERTDDTEATDDTDTTDATDDTGATTGNADYDELLRKARTSSYRVTYASSGTDEEFTIVNDPPNTAFATGGNRYISGDDGVVMCTDVDGSDPQCIKMPGGEQGVDAIVQGFFGAYAALLLADGGAGVFDVADTSEETIAGRNASCVLVEAGALVDADGHLRVCVDTETGVLLLGESEQGDTTSRIEAVAFGEPQPDDFEVPVEPTDLGSVPSLPDPQSP